jgi:tricorn protease
MAPRCWSTPTDRYATEFMAAPAPNGDAVAIVGRGFGLSQWWRKGRSHLDESELWVVRPGDGSAAPKYEQVSARGAKQQWPMWGAGGDAGALYSVSDRNGVQTSGSNRPRASPARSRRSAMDA